MLSKKSFGGNKRNFLKLLMRFVRSDVRDHIASQRVGWVERRGWVRIRSAVGLVERRSFWLPAQVWGQNFLRVATCTGEWISTPLRDDRILTQPLRSTHPTGFD